MTDPTMNAIIFTTARIRRTGRKSRVRHPAECAVQIAHRSAGRCRRFAHARSDAVRLSFLGERTSSLARSREVSDRIWFPIGGWRHCTSRVSHTPGATDVITFQHGEIFISVETAQRNARRFRNVAGATRCVCTSCMDFSISMGSMTRSRPNARENMERTARRSWWRSISL